DLTVFFDISPAEGLLRIARNNEREMNRLDKENISFHEKVYEGYHELIQRYPNRIIKTDARLPEKDVIENVWRIVRPRLM
ncbi:dTMP kinase, partial [Microvirga sp. 3-52]|nr:dTMP kinase [Microvirga sp. 3-52]